MHHLRDLQDDLVPVVVVVIIVVENLSHLEGHFFLMASLFVHCSQELHVFPEPLLQYSVLLH